MSMDAMGDQLEQVMSEWNEGDDGEGADADSEEAGAKKKVRP